MTSNDAAAAASIVSRSDGGAWCNALSNNLRLAVEVLRINSLPCAARPAKAINRCQRGKFPECCRGQRSGWLRGLGSAQSRGELVSVHDDQTTRSGRGVLQLRPSKHLDRRTNSANRPSTKARKPFSALSPQMSAVLIWPHGPHSGDRGAQHQPSLQSAKADIERGF